MLKLGVQGYNGRPGAMLAMLVKAANESLDSHARRACRSSTARAVRAIVCTTAALWVFAAGDAAAINPDHRCVISFGMDELRLTPVADLSYTANYPAQTIELIGTGAEASCRDLVDADTVSFDDNDVTGLLTASFLDSGFPSLTPLNACDFRSEGVAENEDFRIDVIRQEDATGTPFTPEVPVVITGIDCIPFSETTTTTSVTTTTTSTTTTSTTTTTLAGPAVCGDASGDGSVTGTDALIILQFAVGGSGSCPPNVCDADDSGSITVNDALRVLRYSIGLPSGLNCPAS